MMRTTPADLAARGRIRSVLRGLLAVMSWGLTSGPAAAIVALPAAQTDHRPASESDRLLEEARRHESESLKMYRAGAYESALAEGQQALDIRQRVRGPDDAVVASSLNSLGLVYTARSEYAR